MPTLNPPPNSPTWDYAKFKDWLFKLFKWVVGISSPFGSTGTAPQDGGYSNTVALSSALLDGPGTTSYSGNIAPSPDGGYSNILAATTSDAGASLLLGGAPNYLQASNNASPSIPNNSATTVTNWTTILNTGSLSFNSSTGVATVNQAGYYFVSSCLEFSSTAWGAGVAIQVLIVQNSTQQFQGQSRWAAAVTTFGITGTASGILKCAVGDTISVQALQTSGAAVTLANTATNWGNSFSIMQVG